MKIEGNMVPSKFKLWIDDERPKPEGEDWIRAYDATEAIFWLTEGAYDFEFISFDHDLGGDNTSQIVADTLELWAMKGFGKHYRWAIHSANPEGERHLRMALENMDAYWTGRQR
jgi:hypothetical protein